MSGPFLIGLVKPKKLLLFSDGFDCLWLRYLFRVQLSTLHMFFRLYLPPGSGRLRQPATIDPTLDLCTRYPLRLGGPRQCGIRSLPDTSTHGQHWESSYSTTLLHMASTGNRTPDLLILSPTPYPLGHVLPQ